MLLIREVAGWLLVAFALMLIAFALDYVSSRRVVEAGVVVVAAIAVLKAGTLLVRVSTAARIAVRDEQSGRAE